jgi:predicted nucleotide-binding protein
MVRLKAALKRLDENIIFEVMDDQGDFIESFGKRKPEFVVTDLAEQNLDTGEFDMQVGANIATHCAQHVPVYVVTGHYEAIAPGRLGIPDQVQIKSKTLHPSWMATSILEDLKRRGVYVDSKKVFVIYGHDAAMEGLTVEVANYLRSLGLDVDWIRDGNLGTQVLTGLLDKMNSCAAFVAICTPDDKLDGGARFQPRANVLLEMGLAMGLSRGLERLVILQKWGDTVADQAALPSDFGGLIPVRVQVDLHSATTSLRNRLVDLGVNIKASRVS